jgi:protein-disulfide isomerase
MFFSMEAGTPGIAAHFSFEETNTAQAITFSRVYHAGLYDLAMRLSDVRRLSLVASLLFLSATCALAQTVVGVDASHMATPVKDSSMLKPPKGAKIAIIDWTDLECPSCAGAFPFVQLAMKQYGIPLVHYDFLIPGHVWSPKAAVFARYLEDKVSPAISTQYRREVFASQRMIASPDDLDRFTQKFMAAQHKEMPFVVDPTGELRKKVDADCELGDKMGLTHTPTIFVVTADHWIDVANVMQLDDAIRQAKAETASEHSPVHHPAAAQK